MPKTAATAKPDVVISDGTPEAAQSLALPAQQAVKDAAAAIPNGHEKLSSTDAAELEKLMALLSQELAVAQPPAQPTTVAEFSAIDRSKRDHLFYERYLKQFFPRACVIREHFFTNMSPEKIDQALHDLVKVLAEQPWFYFANDPDRVKIALYWEAIADQGALISEFLKKAKVGLADKLVFLSESLRSGFAREYVRNTYYGRPYTGASKMLLLYFKEKRMTGAADFYALLYDYFNKLFNEAVLFKDSKQASSFEYDLEFIIGKLRGSLYERDYQEHYNTSKEVLAILRAKKAADYDDDEDDDDDY